MTLTLTPEQERIIEAEMKKRHLSHPSEVLTMALAVLGQDKVGSEPIREQKSFAAFLEESPLAGAELDLERDRDPGRALDLN